MDVMESYDTEYRFVQGRVKELDVEIVVCCELKLN